MKNTVMLYGFILPNNLSFNMLVLDFPKTTFCIYVFMLFLAWIPLDLSPNFSWNSFSDFNLRLMPVVAYHSYFHQKWFLAECLRLTSFWNSRNFFFSSFWFINFFPWRLSRILTSQIVWMFIMKNVSICSIQSFPIVFSAFMIGIELFCRRFLTRILYDIFLGVTWIFVQSWNWKLWLSVWNYDYHLFY